MGRRVFQSANDRPRNIVAGRFAGIPVMLLTAWSLVGCYSFVPVGATRQAAVSENVRVTLTDAGMAAVQQTLGDNVRALEGVIRRTTADSIVLAVEQTITDTQGTFASSGVTVAIARPLISTVTVRQISRRRSALLILSVVVVVLAALAGSSFAGSTSDGGTNPPPIQP